MESRPYSTLTDALSTVSVKALSKDIRQILARNLDSKQTSVSEKGFARDYRGLAELIGLTFVDIKRIEGLEDRTMRILQECEVLPDAKLHKLISFLEDMDRHDIIEEILPFLRKMFETYIHHQKIVLEEIQSLEEGSVYDAYVCYADADSNLTDEFVRRLESSSVGLKLFIKGRNKLTWYTSLDKALSSENYIIKKQCRHMLILLTPNFIKSPALEFLMNFASSLTDEQKESILMPVILARCDFPQMLDRKFMIDFSKDCTQVWKDLMWDSLIISLLPFTYHILMPTASERYHKYYCYAKYCNTAHMITLPGFSLTKPNKNSDASDEVDDSYLMFETPDLYIDTDAKKYHVFEFVYYSNGKSRVLFNSPNFPDIQFGRCVQSDQRIRDNADQTKDQK